MYLWSSWLYKITVIALTSSTAIINNFIIMCLSYCSFAATKLIPRPTLVAREKNTLSFTCHCRHSFSNDPPTGALCHNDKVLWAPFIWIREDWIVYYTLAVVLSITQSCSPASRDALVVCPYNTLCAWKTIVGEQNLHTYNAKYIIAVLLAHCVQFMCQTKAGRGRIFDDITSTSIGPMRRIL